MLQFQLKGKHSNILAFEGEDLWIKIRGYRKNLTKSMKNILFTLNINGELGVAIINDCAQPPPHPPPPPHPTTSRTPQNKPTQKCNNNRNVQRHIHNQPTPPTYPRRLERTLALSCTVQTERASKHESTNVSV